MTAPFSRRLKIRTKLVLMVGLLLGLMGGGIFLFLPNLAREAKLHALASEMDAIARMTSYSVAPALLFEDRQSALELLEGARHAGRVAYIVVSDQSGEVFVALDPKAAHRPGAPGARGAAAGYYRATAPVERDGAVLGAVHVGASLAPLQTEHAALARRTAALGGLIFLVGLAAAWAIGSVVTRPLRLMVRTAHEIGAGDLGRRAAEGAGDEAGELAESFNHMLDRLQEARAQLEALNEGLERRIEEGISAYRRLEEQFHHAQRMEAVGRLAGGVAHDFNNLLTAILGYAELTLSTLPEGRAERPHLEEIRKAGERAAALTQQLLAFSRKQVVHRQVLDLNDVVAGMGRMMERLIPGSVRLENRLAPYPLPVSADRGQLEQVLVNVVVNARDAMPDGGTLVVRTSEITVDGTGPWAAAGAEAGPYVLLEIRDTGVGMDEETRNRIFEPFFTTKAMGVGTGLGLATVFAIVSENRGNIRVETEPDRGTTVGILLPHCRDEVVQSAPPAAEAAVRNGSETLLLVEDEDAVRDLMAEILGAQGYRVLVAPGGSRALELSRAHSGEVHLVIADVVMPGMGGRETVEELRRQRPELPALFISGYIDDTILRHGVDAHETPFLGKPFSAAELLTRVRELLPTA